MHSLRRYDWLIHLSAIALCAYFLANSFVIYLSNKWESVEVSATALPPQTSTVPDIRSAAREFNLEDFKVVTERNVFNAAEVVKLPNTEETPLPDRVGNLGPAEATKLDIKVLGTLAVGDGTDRRSSAVIQGGPDNSGTATFFSMDKKSFGKNIRITKIMKDRVEFLNGGRLEYKELEGITSKTTVYASADDVHGRRVLPASEKEQTPSSEGGKIVIEQKKVDEALQNLDKLQGDVRIVPNYRDNKLDGMKVLSIRPGSVVSELGIRRGDVLQKVNGRDLDIQRGLELFSSMKDMKNFSLEISRGGKNQTLEYEIR